MCDVSPTVLAVEQQGDLLDAQYRRRRRGSSTISADAN
jgi:hypothetical protein